MRKMILCLIVLLISCSFAYAAEEFKFRGVTWGMTQDEVRAVETGDWVTPEKLSLSNMSAEERDDYLKTYSYYDVREPVLGIREGRLIYVFRTPGGRNDLTQDKLQSFYIIFSDYKDEPGDIERAVADYHKLITVLSKEYGGHVGTAMDGISPEGEKLWLEECALEEFTPEKIAASHNFLTVINNVYDDDNYKPEKAMLIMELKWEEWTAGEKVLSISCHIMPSGTYLESVLSGN